MGWMSLVLHGPGVLQGPVQDSNDKDSFSACAVTVVLHVIIVRRCYRTHGSQAFQLDSLNLLPVLTLRRKYRS